MPGQPFSLFPPRSGRPVPYFHCLIIVVGSPKLLSRPLRRLAKSLQFTDRLGELAIEGGRAQLEGAICKRGVAQSVAELVSRFHLEGIVVAVAHVNPSGIGILSILAF